MLNRSFWGTSGSRIEDEFPVSEGDMKSPRFMKLKETEGLVGESLQPLLFLHISQKFPYFSTGWECQIFSA